MVQEEFFVNFFHAYFCYYYCSSVHQLNGFKKLSTLTFLYLHKIKSVEWLGIDSGMLKLIERNCGPFLGVITQCLSPPLKLAPFPIYMLDRVWIQSENGHQQCTLLMIITCKLSRNGQSRTSSMLSAQNIVKYPHNFCI